MSASTLYAADEASSAPSPTPSNCAAWRRAYREAQECFAPYHNVNGTLKPGAYENCAEVLDPEPTCGPESWYHLEKKIS